MRRIMATVSVFLALATFAYGGEIGFMEDFSLAADRTVPLKQLIPGTEDYYYFHALHYLNTEQFGKVDELLVPWVQRHGETPRVWETRTRLALLSYDKNPDKSLDYLRRRLNLQFNHQKEVLGQEPNLPTVLDPKSISRVQLMARANSQPNNLNLFEDSALEWLITDKLNPDRRRQLLQRLTRPDYPNLAQIVIDDLNYVNSPGFGAFGIHRQLLLSQLEECLKLKPDLLNQQNFVQAYISKLRPTADEDWRHDPQVLEAYLVRLWSFAQKLAPVHNSLKAHILYHWLVLDRQRGTYNRERFMTYLQLPRNVHYVAVKFMERDENRRFAADLNSDFATFTLLSPIGNDEPLVRSYLSFFFVDATGYKEFETYIQDNYLKHLFAETKILNGLGEPEQWASLLPPELYKQLKERVDIDFAFTNQTMFNTDESVRLELQLKNVSTLIVKVFELNTKNYYRQYQREVDTDINLDGLVANEEQTYTYTDPALRRVSRRFDFAKLTKPGVYVIDFIGNGRSSRALIRKGKLRQIVTTGAAGQVFTILNEKNQLVPDARLWLAGHEYSANKEGTINVPFSTAPGRQPIVIERGDFASLDHFNHEAENYSLVAGIYVDREALLTRKKAQVIVRPGMYLNGTPSSLKLLDEVKLTITSTDHDNVATSQEIPNFTLFEDRDTIHEFQVPARLSSISFTLSAKVKRLTAGGTKMDLAVTESFSLNQIDKTDKIEDLHLSKIGDDYFVELFGKTGEPKISRPVRFVLKHRDFREPIYFSLKSDARGRIALGALTDIVSVNVTNPENTSQTWVLGGDQSTYAQTLHGRVGDVLVLPYLPSEKTATQGAALRNEVSLLELRGDTYLADRFENVSIKNGLLQIEKLAAGDYDLLLKAAGARVRVRIVDGEKQNGFILGKLRQLETKRLKPIQIEAINVADDKVTIRLQDVSTFARVHVFATRFWPAYSAFRYLAHVRDSEPYMFQAGTAESVYLTGRNIGDEYRYIIDRKYATKYPGNGLDRPSLLLNPWAVRTTETGEQVALGGDEFAARGGRADSLAEQLKRAAGGKAGAPQGFSNLDFLANGSAVLVNLAPDKDGVITIPRDAFGLHQHVHVVAVDPLNTTYRSIALPEVKSAFIDLRLLNGLDPQSHFTQQKQVSVVPAGQAFVLNDVTTSKFEAYDTLSRAYALYATLTHDPKLAEFNFVLQWPKLKPEEKRAQYSKYASHELSFFLAKKDPEFYKQTIQPYLANKKDKTFMDRWLLEEDLKSFLEPWKYGQLNTVERVLLAQRIQGEQPATARSLGDQLSLLPPNIDRFIQLFDTAVKGSALEMDDRLGLQAKLGELKPNVNLEMSAMAAAAPAKAGNAPIAGDLPAAPPGSLRRNANADVARKKFAEEETKAEKAKQDMQGQAKEGRARRELADGKPQADKDAVARDEVFFDRALAERQEVRQLYRKLDKTMEWAENNYHHLTIDQQNAALVGVNAFWKDYAQQDPAQKFYSRNMAEASHNFPEMLLALGILDLPFDPAKLETKFEGAKMTLTANSPLIVYHEEIKAAQPSATPVPILVSQNFYRQGDRHRQENGEQVDKFVTEEFLVHAVYGCQVVVTNPTSARQKLSVLLQVPQGAMPVLNGQFTRTVHLSLEPYHTQTIDYHFYFPLPGSFAHYPVHIAKNEDLITFAKPFVFNVVDKPTKIDTDSWEYVSQNGTPEEVVQFLNKRNVNGLNLDKIAFRMRDPKFFTDVTKLLAQRHVYQHTLWSYSLLHNVPAAAREFLQYADQIANECGGRLTSTLVTYDPVARHSFEHLEYKPLVNARAHMLGKRRQILNNRFNEQYHAFLKELGYQRTPSDDDQMAITYYLLLQDRIEEALAAFGRVNASRLATRMQYDYLTAYLDFYTGNTAEARAIAVKYANHPVDRWRNTFAAISSQLDEIDGKGPQTIDTEDRSQQQTALAASEPNFDFQVEAKQLTINYQNLETIRVNYYLMDVELLFSRNPFVQQFSGQFSSILPNHTESINLKQMGTAGQKVTTSKEGASPVSHGSAKIPLPAALHNKNVLVEITGGGQTKTQAYYSHTLAIQVVENYGHLRVTHAQSGKPITKAYVKVYAQMHDGSVRFYKDGYTDLRGRFDYTSLNTNELEIVTKFSLLIMSDDSGAVVREANPPKR